MACLTFKTKNMLLPVKKYFIAALLCFQLLQASAKDYPASLFGIYSDGVTLNTRSIQFGIDYVHQQGGGRLVFDVGRYLTGSIHLKSNVTLHLMEGAVLLYVISKPQTIPIPISLFRVRRSCVSR